jgi:peptidoglycan hydrolase-like protein with peptidoglycan-binding domain
MAEPVLRKGSTDPAVRDLQQALKALGHDPGPIDGVFGDATESAVKAFQQEKEITVDGVVGKVTWINIDEADQSEPVLRIGSTGLPVRRAQKRCRWTLRSQDRVGGQGSAAAIPGHHRRGGRSADLGNYRRFGGRRTG